MCSSETGFEPQVMKSFGSQSRPTLCSNVAAPYNVNCVACVIAENSYLKLKPPQAKADPRCSPPPLTSHVPPGKRPLAPTPAKFHFAAEKPFAASPYENTAIPSPSESVCSSASGKQSASPAGLKDAAPGPEYGAAATTGLYTHMERWVGFLLCRLLLCPDVTSDDQWLTRRNKIKNISVVFFFPSSPSFSPNFSKPQRWNVY